MKGTKVVVMSLLSLLLYSCGSYKLDEAQNSIKEQFAARNYEKTAELVQKYRKEKVYQDKDRVLFHLELATANHFAGNHKGSVSAFGDAEIAIDDEFTKSIARGAKSILTNDNQLAYDGEPYEDVYINAFKSLSFLKQGDLDGAQVEARRMTYKMENLDIKYKGLAESMSKKESEKDTANFSVGKMNIQNSSLSHYLSAVIFAKQFKPDNARIEVDRLKTAIDEQITLFAFPKPKDELVDIIEQPESYNLMVVGFAGRAPFKEQIDNRIYIEDMDFYVKYSLPQLKRVPSNVASIKVYADGKELGNLEMIESMEGVAEQIFRVKEPIIRKRTIIRATSKAIAGKLAEKRAEKESEGLGMIVGLVGQIATETTEKADLRGWQTLPGRAYSNLFQLNAGTHSIKIDYFSSIGTVVFSEEKTIEIGSGPEHLSLFESLYWN